MPRIARIVAVGFPHHITQRGNYRQDVFLDDKDRLQYLSWVQEYSTKYSLSILAYCLMQNHVHFIAIPDREDSLSRTFNTAHMCYSQHFNKKIKTYGHLWQGRFFSCVLDEPHLIVAARYIERNPVRANIIRKPWQWQWSSALAHIDKDKKAQPHIKLDSLFDFIDMSFDSWKEFIDSPEEEKAIGDVRKHTLTGYPLGETSFIEKLEKKFGRMLRALPRGRPKKK